MNTLILCGGPSVEHDVSLWSAKNVVRACSDTGYNPIVVYISKSGSWKYSESLAKFFKESEPANLNEETVLNEVKSDLVLLPGSGLYFENTKLDIDVAFPIVHGTFGEDGTLQAILESINIPYVGCGVAASAIAMDKVATKQLASAAGIPIARFEVVRASQGFDADAIVQNLGLPIFVKPARSGSSVGVTKVKRAQDLTKAIEDAARIDDKVLIEEMVNGREIECSFLHDGELLVSRTGEVATTHEFYSYDAKYLDEASVTITVPTDIPKEIESRMQEYVRTIVREFDLKGLSRIDFFYTESGEVILNEINTLPGFTLMSMYPRLWELEGYSGGKLVHALIQNALK